MYSATENRSLPKRRRSTLQPTGSGSPVDRLRDPDETTSFGQLIHHQGDRVYRRGSDLPDKAELLPPPNSELNALCGVADGRVVVCDLHLCTVEACGGERLYVGAS